MTLNGCKEIYLRDLLHVWPAVKYQQLMCLGEVCYKLLPFTVFC